ncbi:MAG: putative sensor protein [Frankiales bacterium]|nr:putative sensor protein [Frankiales bacterium]
MDAFGDLRTFGLGDMVRLSSTLRGLGEDSPTVTDFATRVCSHLHEYLLGADGERQTLLVRFYGTVAHGALPADEQAFVAQVLDGAAVSDALNCLTLLGTAGVLPEWNDRRASRGHRVIPLTDAGRVAGLPMVAALLEEIGIDAPALVAARSDLLLPGADHLRGVFHVPHAAGSPVIPAQDFVAAYGVESVLGFGGALPTGEVYAVVLFASVPVPAGTAEMFETVSLSTTLAALDMIDAPVFARVAPAGGRPVPHPVSALERSRARELVLGALLDVHERVAVAEAAVAGRALELATREAQRHGALTARLRLAQDIAHIGIWDWNLQTGDLVWDAHCAGLFGITLDEFAGDLGAFDALVHPEDVPRVHAGLQNAIASGGAIEQDYRVIRPDGRERRHLSRGQALVDDSGQVVRLIGAVLDVTDMRAAADARSRLAAVALRLSQADTVAQVNQVVIDHGFAALGAAGGGLMLRNGDGETLDVTLSGFYGPDIEGQIPTLPLDFDVPAVHTARTGEPLYFGDLDSMLREFPAQVELLRAAEVEAAACLPLRMSGRLLGSLTATWKDAREFDAGEVELVEALAAQCGQALERVRAMEAEREAMAAARSMSESLQRSLLTSPPESDDLEIVVRYQPATQEVQVGGDWYDAFVTPDGVTNVVIGDVTGHDRDAAARMGQVRNLLRATAYALVKPPAAVLQALEQALTGLSVDTLATAVLARIEQTDEQRARGVRLLRWSNAGHLPPLVRAPDGTTTVLSGAPDLLLGLDPDAERIDSVVEVAAGTTLLLYTDGLVERRGEDLDAGIDRLRVMFADVGGEDLATACDRLLEDLLGDGAEDDVALLAVRFRDQH